MPPKSDKNKSNPEKHAELSKLWETNLKYDDHAYIERDEIVYLLNNYLLTCELEIRRV
jgi:hypothetical protein